MKGWLISARGPCTSAGGRRRCRPAAPAALQGRSRCTQTVLLIHTRAPAHLPFTVSRDTAQRFDEVMLAVAATAVPDGVGLDVLLAASFRIPVHLNIALPEAVTDFAIGNIVEALSAWNLGWAEPHGEVTSMFSLGHPLGRPL
jgi:hypothetical protein